LPGAARPIFYNSTVVRIGVAGWKYKDWEGIVYPAKPRARGFDELAYISNYFDTVEINSSFYGAPRPTSAKKWAESVSDNESFRFAAKLFHSFTHERKPAPNDEKDFKDGIAPLIEAGRLGALLIQFPWSFKNSPESREYLIGLQKRFQEYPLVVEVRHGSWIEEGILDLFGELGIGICNIDQPLFHRSVKPAAHVTSTIATCAFTAATTASGSRRKLMCGRDTITCTRWTNSIHGWTEPSRSHATRKIHTL
jgi:uncharacterized protein YecE (DUF72 family)